MRLFIAAAIFLLTASTGMPQATARQGTEDTTLERKQQRFRSPMIVEVPFAAADESTWGKGQIRGEFIGHFICDGVSFRDFAVSVDRSHGNTVKLTYYSVLANEPGVDKLVTLRFTLLRGDRVLDETLVPWFEVEERNISVRSALASLPATTLKGADVPILRITMSAKDDD